MTVPYPEQPPPGQPPPPGYGWGGQPPPPPPYYPAPQHKSRRGLWLALGAVALVALAVIATTVVLFLTRESGTEPDITALTTSMLIDESEFGNVAQGEFSSDGPNDDPEWEKLDVDPSECEYMVQYPRASEQVRGERSNPDGEGFIVTLRINTEWPDLKALLAECDSKQVTYEEIEGTVHALDLSDLPDWAVAVEVESEDLGGGGFSYVVGYYRGIQIDVEHFGATTSKSDRADLVRMFNAQVERLSKE